MKKIMFILIAVIAAGCAEKKHNVSFSVGIDSTNGEKRLIVDCYESESYLNTQKAMNDLLSGRSKAQPQEPKAIAHYDSRGKPESNFKFKVELPEKFVVCIVDRAFPIKFRIGTQAGTSFKASADSELNFRYNMFTSSFSVIESNAKSVELVNL